MRLGSDSGLRRLFSLAPSEIEGIDSLAVRLRLDQPVVPTRRGDLFRALMREEEEEGEMRRRRKMMMMMILQTS